MNKCHPCLVTPFLRFGDAIRLLTPANWAPEIETTQSLKTGMNLLKIQGFKAKNAIQHKPSRIKGVKAKKPPKQQQTIERGINLLKKRVWRHRSAETGINLLKSRVLKSNGGIWHGLPDFQDGKSEVLRTQVVQRPRNRISLVGKLSSQSRTSGKRNFWAPDSV